LFSRTKSSSILSRRQKRLDHIGVDEIAVEAVQLIQPEVVTLKVERLLWHLVGISSQIPEVLRQHKRAAEFLLRQYVLCARADKSVMFLAAP
jgi:hypothetical protein